MRGRSYAAAVALLVLLACGRMAATFRVFSATTDEATHVGGGLELFGRHRYELQRENPPLPRIVIAAAPWFGGMRYNPHAETFGGQLHSVFYDHGKYERNLFLARLGNLLFFTIAALALAAWTRREIDERTAVIAVLLFTMQPIVLGYSALATHDAAATAGTAVALLAMSHWLTQRDARTSALLGLAYAFGVLCKFSCIAYVPLGCAAIYAVRLCRHADLRRGAVRDVAQLVAIVLPAAALVTWAGYGFTYGAALDLWRALPAPAFFVGLTSIIQIDRAGFLSYAFGRTSMTGWWWYFPMAMLLKTTLPFLTLLAIGPSFVRRDPKLAWPAMEAMAAAAAMLALAMHSTLDIGVRYLLPLYVPLSLAAGAATAAMLRQPRTIIRAAAVSLLSLHIVVSAAAHPDYFPFFNALAGPEPGRDLIDSNLDWGQDVLRLRSATRELKIDRLGVSLLGLADLDALGFPPHYQAVAERPSTGWVAVSEQSYRMMDWGWLADRPYRRIGRSIRLYYVGP